jgi:hypothetical protein
MPKQEYKLEPKGQVVSNKPCPSCSDLIAPLQAKLDAFVMFLCAPVAKCQSCGLIASKLTTVVHPVMGRSEHLCCEKCTPAQAKVEGCKLEHAPIGDDTFQSRVIATNALICEARAHAC